MSSASSTPGNIDIPTLNLNKCGQVNWKQKKLIILVHHIN